MRATGRAELSEVTQMTDAVDFVPREVGIWRYMDVGRFIALIDEKHLYFARLHELGDPWEGVWTKPASARLISRIGSEYAGRVIKKLSNLALVSCWHENERESVAMWKLYVSGREGVALKTTVGRLEGALSASPAGCLDIERVRYEDITYDPRTCDYDRTGYAGWFHFRKGTGYEHEREVRAVSYFPYPSVQHASAEACQAANSFAPASGIAR